MSKRRQKEKINAMFEEEEVKPTKEECQVAKFLISHLPEKEGKLHGMPVKIFIGEEAVEALLSDAFRKSKIAKSVHITDIASAVSCLRTLMSKQMFHRAERVLKKKRDKDEIADKPSTSSRKRRKDDEKATSSKHPKSSPASGDEPGTANQGNGSCDEPIAGEEKTASDQANGKSDDTKDVFPRSKKKDKKKRKIKLTMHEDQIFLNADEVYVWIYDPVRLKNVIGGIGMVVLTIVCCLFPLWPNVLKSGAYYVSVGGLGLVGLLVGIGVLRCLLFVLFWAFSFGNHHFWLFPNFSEDCGVIESFQPLYSYEIRSTKESDKAITASSGNETVSEEKTKAD